VDGRTQAVRIQASSGAMSVISDAPFVVLDPVPLPGGRLAFVNREGWGWTLDWMDVGSGRPITPQQTAQGPSPEAELAAEPDVPVLSDDPYQPFDHLLVPTLRGPFIAFGSREQYGGT